MNRRMILLCVRMRRMSVSDEINYRCWYKKDLRTVIIRASTETVKCALCMAAAKMERNIDSIGLSGYSFQMRVLDINEYHTQ